MKDDSINDAALFEDLAATFNAAGGITEFAFATPGKDRPFWQALYVDDVTPELLQHLAAEKRNVSFLSGCDPELLAKSAQKQIQKQTEKARGKDKPLTYTVFELGQFCYRSAEDEVILRRNIISFDLDFKDSIPDFLNLPPKEKRRLIREHVEKWIPLLESVFDKGAVWIIVSSGNGVHIHLRTNTFLDCSDADVYKEFYVGVKRLLEEKIFQGFKIDESCKNPSRLMRLPGSTNWKDPEHPLPVEVLFHDPDADASDFVTIQVPSTLHRVLAEGRETCDAFVDARTHAIEEIDVGTIPRASRRSAT